MGILDFLFTNKKKIVEDFISRGAIIIDVRTKAEYNNGAIKGSKNIPLQIINSKINEIKKFNKPIIACCESGMRSGNAARILKSYNIETVNGGGWKRLNRML